MSDQEYVDPNSGRSMQPGAAFPGMQPGGVVPGDDTPMKATEPADEPKVTGDDGSDVPDGGDDNYDPSEHTVDEVQAYVADNPDQKDAVLKAEKAGKNRTTLVSALESPDE